MTHAAYAVTCENSRGRKIPEPPHPYRGPFERDRSRIIHSAAFRRLEGKTQVFTTGINDQYRTRLTHSIEVAQVGRTLACALGLNESLTETICLAHDLGHSPFGHVGERVLNELMAETGGFEHNRQSLRIVDFVEHPYPDFAGLNLMFETRRGLAKHHSPYDLPETHAEFGTGPCSLEGQIADVADRIAYNTHDLEDGLRSRLLNEPQLVDLELVEQARKEIDGRNIVDNVIRRMQLFKMILDLLVTDAIETSRDKIRQCGIETLEDVYGCGQCLIGLSEEKNRQLEQLEKFLMQTMYRSGQLEETSGKIKQWLTLLFEMICNDPKQMPTYYQEMIPTEGLHRTVCDYVSGMTDRYALRLLEK